MEVSMTKVGPNGRPMEFDIVCAPVDAAGDPAPLDGPIRFAVNRDDLVEVIQLDDLSCTVRSLGQALGTCQVSLEADARLGPDVVLLTAAIDVTLHGGEAIGLGLNVTAVREQP